MDRVVQIGTETVTLRASALIPRLYRHAIGRDVVRDMGQLRRAYQAAAQAREAGCDEDGQNEAGLSVLDLEIFENIAWVMLRHGAVRDENGLLMNGGMIVGDSPDEWLEQLDGVFDVYQILPVILELWSANQSTTSTPAKK